MENLLLSRRRNNNSEALVCQQNSPLSNSENSKEFESVIKYQPKKLIETVAKLLYLRIKADKNIAKGRKKSHLKYFNVFQEKTYFTEYSNVKELSKNQSIKDIAEFMEAVMERCILSVEFSVMTLYYIMLFLEKSGLALQNGNIRTLIFVSLLIAQKVYEDQVTNNQYFAEEIYPFYSNKDLNKIEAAFLTIINFRPYIHIIDYQKYCTILKDNIYSTTLYNKIGFQEGNNFEVLEDKKKHKSETIVNCYRS